MKLDPRWKNRIAQKLIVFGLETQEFLQGDQFKITDRDDDAAVQSARDVLRTVSAKLDEEIKNTSQKDKDRDVSDDSKSSSKDLSKDDK